MRRPIFFSPCHEWAAVRLFPFWIFLFSLFSPLSPTIFTNDGEGGTVRLPVGPITRWAVTWTGTVQGAAVL